MIVHKYDTYAGITTRQVWRLGPKKKKSLYIQESKGQGLESLLYLQRVKLQLDKQCSSPVMIQIQGGEKQVSC